MSKKTNIFPTAYLPKNTNRDQLLKVYKAVAEMSSIEHAIYKNGKRIISIPTRFVMDTQETHNQCGKLKLHHEHIYICGSCTVTNQTFFLINILTEASPRTLMHLLSLKNEFHLDWHKGNMEQPNFDLIEELVTNKSIADLSSHIMSDCAHNSGNATDHLLLTIKEWNFFPPDDRKSVFDAVAHVICLNDMCSNKITEAHNYCNAKIFKHLELDQRVPVLTAFDMCLELPHIKNKMKKVPNAMQKIYAIRLYITGILVINDPFDDPFIDYVAFAKEWLQTTCNILGIRLGANVDKYEHCYKPNAGQHTKFTVHQCSKQITRKLLLPNQDSMNCNKFEATNRPLKKVLSRAPFGVTDCEAGIEHAKFKLLITLLAEGCSFDDDGNPSFQTGRYKLNHQCLNVVNLMGDDWDGLSCYVPINEKKRCKSKLNDHQFSHKRLRASGFLNLKSVRTLIEEKMRDNGIYSKKHRVTEYKQLKFLRGGFRMFLRIGSVIPHESKYLIVYAMAKVQTVTSTMDIVAGYEGFNKYPNLWGSEGDFCWRIVSNKVPFVMKVEDIKTVLVSIDYCHPKAENEEKLIYWFNRRSNGEPRPPNPFLKLIGNKIGTPLYHKTKNN